MQEGSLSPYLLAIDDITLNPNNGSVQISYNVMNGVQIQGSGNDPAVQQMLTLALLNSGELSLRLRAVKVLEQMACAGMELDDAYVNTLGQILAHENNTGVKLSIVKILACIHTKPRARDLLIRSMLTDDNEAIRIQAFKSLTQNQNETDASDSFLSTTKTDSNTYIRTKSLELLNNRKGTSL